MKEVVIVSAVRTPIGTPIGTIGGSLKEVTPQDLGGIAIREAIARAGIGAARNGVKKRWQRVYLKLK